MGGLAGNFAVLIAARVLQGIGAGGLMALSEVSEASSVSQSVVELMVLGDCDRSTTSGLSSSVAKSDFNFLGHWECDR
jgi:hypothetical protein